ncbi:esterase-like activity of phytase family protein [Novosphingobium panipatense]|uniref:Phytase-like domain-containing protein n=1 Tax=Novosphingobium panipatense TaxID=428991 RepID=A0ABY1QDT7_9SPHN|nr:esterase-like activity of phytase family protein [Novosphingobium panipatense]SMP68010.1 hypothetical protein SAMN06296065_104310 [Novosphingobium panipatense]
MRRSLPLVTLAFPLLWATWARSERPQTVQGADAELTIERQKLPARPVLDAYLGPLRLEGAWQYRSPNQRISGYSALVALKDGRLRAFSDSGEVLSFPRPPGPGSGARTVSLRFSLPRNDKAGRDVESVAFDPKTGRQWVALEGSNRIVRLSPKLRETGHVHPAGMARWGRNSGAEAMARLRDGRFVVIREVTTSILESRRHEALLFAGDPVDHPVAQAFHFEGPDNFSVVDMAVLPDGRALVLMRRLLWPLPMRYAGRIVLADTAQIRPGTVWRSTPVASLASVLPGDNFEAIAAVPGKDGRIVVWLMSDDNAMRVLQRTLLWKLSVHPADLPGPR